MFRKPKKIQRRVFSSALEEEDEMGMRKCDIHEKQVECKNTGILSPSSPRVSAKSEKNKSQMTKSKNNDKECSNVPKSLLSFADEEEDGEIFQVRKSSHSKKVMRMLDKERRRKKKEVQRDCNIITTIGSMTIGTESTSSTIYNDLSEDHYYNEHNESTMHSNEYTYLSNSNYLGSSTMTTASTGHRNSIKSDKIQTEIRTDDFVLVVKKSEPNVILNGREGLCDDRNDLSDEGCDEECESTNGNGIHRFSKPDHLKQILQSGSIPDAAMIHAARKRRQKAREQGDFTTMEEHKTERKKVTHKDIDGDNSDEEERIDMDAITGVKEREKRREQFYAVEKDYSEEDSDCETHEWENQQIRKGVTGAQLGNTQHESVLSRFIIKSTGNVDNEFEHGITTKKSTSTLLEQAYAKCSLERSQKLFNLGGVKKDEAKAFALRSPQEIRDTVAMRLNKLKDANAKHCAHIENVLSELHSLQLEEMNCKQKAPTAAAKYRFYQEIKCYVSDLIDCLNEKTPLISDVEKRMLQFYTNHYRFLIERRQQDVRDQAKELAEVTKLTSNKRTVEHDEAQIRRATEREGRRTRRRFDRERNNTLSSHWDGMSSDEETSDRYQEQFQNALEQLDKEALNILNDVNNEFCKIELILMKFCSWRKTDYNSYKDAYVSLCLPKVLGPLVRLEMLSWSPLMVDYKDIEKMNWYSTCMLYAWSKEETENDLKEDPDNQLVPILIEKIILPKISDIVTYCWDPLSTTKTLRLIGFINRLNRDYPLKETSKLLQKLFNAILEKMKLALENDVFIPIFPKQVQENKTSFFQRQFCSGLKLFRNFLSWQGIIADKPLREMAINSLLNRYLLMALRVCSFNDAIAKASMIVNILPTVWLQPESDTLRNLEPFILHIKQIMETSDYSNPSYIQSIEKAKKILQRLHCN